MTSSSRCFFLVLMLVLLVSPLALASTKYIDQICCRESVEDKTFCLKTLTTYPSAVLATSLFPLVEIAFRLATSYAEKTAGFAAEAAKNEPTLKWFKLCNESFIDLARRLRLAESELKEDVLTANYDVMVCYDTTHHIKDLIEKNRDKASEKLMKMTLLMEKFLSIVVGATDAIDISL